jgi:hypothetical protein
VSERLVVIIIIIIIIVIVIVIVIVVATVLASTLTATALASTVTATALAFAVIVAASPRALVAAVTAVLPGPRPPRVIVPTPIPRGRTIEGRLVLVVTRVGTWTPGSRGGHVGSLCIRARTLAARHLDKEGVRQWGRSAILLVAPSELARAPRRPRETAQLDGERVVRGKDARPCRHEAVKPAPVSGVEALFDVAQEREFVRVAGRDIATGNEQHRQQRRRSHRSTPPMARRQHD